MSTRCLPRAAPGIRLASEQSRPCGLLGVGEGVHGHHRIPPINGTGRDSWNPPSPPMPTPQDSGPSLRFRRPCS